VPEHLVNGDEQQQLGTALAEAVDEDERLLEEGDATARDGEENPGPELKQMPS